MCVCIIQTHVCSHSKTKKVRERKRDIEKTAYEESNSKRTRERERE